MHYNAYVFTNTTLDNFMKQPVVPFRYIHLFCRLHIPKSRYSLTFCDPANSSKHVLKSLYAKGMNIK